MSIFSQALAGLAQLFEFRTQICLRQKIEREPISTPIVRRNSSGCNIGFGRRSNCASGIIATAAPSHF